MNIIKLFPLFILFIFQTQQKGCDKGKEEKVNLEKQTADLYDAYILDMPFDRNIYQNLKVKERKMMEVSTVDLPAEEGYIVRKDSFDLEGKIVKSSFDMEGTKDSLKYEYKETGQIAAVHTYNQDVDSTSIKYFYDNFGMMTQIIYYREKVTAFDLDYNKYGKLTDKKLSDESPNYSPKREIYRYNSFGKMVQGLILTNNVITAKEARIYDKKKRIATIEQYANGIIMSSSAFLYNEQGLINIRKDKFRVTAENEETKIYEFIYEYY